jgi:pilus assembly protein CpaE
MDFYRRVTRGLGVREYLFKPLTVEMVARHFAPALSGRLESASALRGGRVLTVIGARPGVGASTIAANLAWYLGALASRHTLLLDPDLQTGTAALMVGVQATPALRAGLENPGRLDELYVGRAVQAAGPRLDVLATESALDEHFSYTTGAADRLIDMLQRRYNFIVIDLPVGHSPLLRELRERSHQSVIVLDSSLPAIRDTLRLLALPVGPRQVRRPLLVLNRAGVPGTLSKAQVEEALQLAPEIVIPDIGRHAREAELSGKPAISSRGSMRDAIAQIALSTAGVRPDMVRRGFLQRFFK